MRVLHINAGNLYGGVETLLITCARFRHLCPGMQPEFALCFEGRLSRELREAGVPVHLVGNVRASRPWTVWNARRTLRLLLEDRGYDTVICHMPWSLAIFGGMLKAFKQPHALWVHNFMLGIHWTDRWAAMNRPQLVISNGVTTSPGAHKLFPSSTHEIVHCPVSPVVVAQGTRAAIRRKLSVSDDTVVIVQVSRMEALKGHDCHLRALAELATLDTPWQCWFVGGAQRPPEKEYEESLKQLASELDIEKHIRFLGERTDVADILAGADIFCQPNHSPETFGIVFVEALWSGLPLIATAIGGANIIADASCAILISPGDVTGLADALKQCVESSTLRTRLGTAAPVRAKLLCDPARQLNRLYESLSVHCASSRVEQAPSSEVKAQ